jgi:dUTP pyrophosphatase
MKESSKEPENPVDTINTDHLVVKLLSKNTRKSKLLSKNTRKPSKATLGAAGYDVFNAVTATLQPGQRGLFPLNIQVMPPEGTYIQIKSRSGIAVKNTVDIRAGIIDADYTSNVTVVMHNYGEQEFKVNVGAKLHKYL